MTCNDETTPAEKFEAFHQRNPHVREMLVRLSQEWHVRTGGQKLGMQMLFERARWEFGLQTDEESPRLNDHYTPFYSRMLMAEYPRLDGMFDVRAADADEWALDKYGIDFRHDGDGGS